MTTLIILNSIIVATVLYHYIFRSKLPDVKYLGLKRQYLELSDEFIDFVKEQTDHTDKNSKLMLENMTLMLENMTLKTQQQCNHNYSRVTKFDFTNGNKFNETVIKCNKCNHSIKVN